MQESFKGDRWVEIQKGDTCYIIVEHGYSNAEYKVDINWNLDKKKGNKVFLYEEIYNQHPLFKTNLLY